MKIDGVTPMALTAAPEARAADLRKAAEGFEAIFLNTFLKAARSASLGEDIMGGNGVDQTRDMFDAEVTKMAAGRAGLGLADAVERQFQSFVTSKG